MRVVEQRIPCCEARGYTQGVTHMPATPLAAAGMHFATVLHVLHRKGLQSLTKQGWRGLASSGAWRGRVHR